MRYRPNYDSGMIADPERMIVPIAIREDLVARLQIPVDLTLPEAEKIARVVLAYAIADRNGNRQDHEDGLGPKDESGGAEGNRTGNIA